MTTVVLVHGWGYDASLWDGVREVLDPALAVETLDLGFFGKERKVDADGTVLAVGHSLGVLWWLTQARMPWRTLLAINGFPRFTETAGYAPAVAPRALARMQQQFAKSPTAVLQDFHSRCGGQAPTDIANVERLATGLGWLAELDGRAAATARHSDIVALAGSDDPIVPRPMSEMAWGKDCVCVDTATPGHLLPLTHPALCAEWIERLAA